MKQPIEMSRNYNDFHPKAFAEFFAGIGLMRLGLERAGWQIAKYGGKWDFWGQTASRLSSYKVV